MTSRDSRRMTRRSMLRRAGGMGVAAAVSPAWSRPIVGAARADQPLSLTLNFSNGASLSFNETGSTQLGEYLGAFVRQKCLRQRSGPWTVFFRPDTDGSRHEIVVEYGTELNFAPNSAPVPVSGASPAHILSPYTATISGGGLAGPVTIRVPKHWWGARWRWQSGRRPIVRRLADLVAMKALPPYAAAALYNGPQPPARGIAWAGPMTTAGLDTGMGDTGDRPEIGFITEFQACYLLAVSSVAEETMRSQAEAAGTLAIHVRDAATGAPFSVQKYPYTALLYSMTPDKNKIPPPRQAVSAPEWFVTNLAHFPSLGFVPWLLTDDPFFLEEEQFASNYGMIEGNYHNLNEKLPGLCGPSQTRGWAWGMRNLFRMAAFAPEQPPAWLAPRSYWRACVADNLTYAKKYVASPSPLCKIFNMIIETGFISVFMVDYLEIVLGWAAWSGLFPDWAPVVAYAAGPRLAMFRDPAAGPGWDRRLPAPYEVPLATATQGARASLENTPYPQYAPPPTENSAVPANWAELWSDFVTWFNAQHGATPIDPPSWSPNVLSPAQHHGYLEEARAALAALALSGSKEAMSEHRWVAPQMTRVFEMDHVPSLYKWAIWPG